MNNNERFTDTLIEMLRAIIDIRNFTNGMSLSEFVSDTKTVAATKYTLTRLGNAARNATKRARTRGEKLPSNIPWGKTASISRWLEGYRQKVSPSVIWQTIVDDLPEIEKGLRELIKDYPNEILPEKNKVKHLTLVSQTNIQLSSYTLELNVVPYLKAITNLQELINEIFERNEPEPILVKSISQNSPLEVALAGLLEAYKLLQDWIPWRREHAKIMAKLLENEKMVEIKKGHAEVLQIQALTAKEIAETEKIKAETILHNEQFTKLRLENEKLRSEIENDRNNKAIETLTKLSTTLQEKDARIYFAKLRESIDIFVESDLEIAG